MQTILYVAMFILLNIELYIKLMSIQLIAQYYIVCSCLFTEDDIFYLSMRAFYSYRHDLNINHKSVKLAMKLKMYPC